MLAASQLSHHAPTALEQASKSQAATVATVMQTHGTKHEESKGFAA